MTLSSALREEALEMKCLDCRGGGKKGKRAGRTLKLVKCKEEEKSPTENTIMTAAWREEIKVKSVRCANGRDSMNEVPPPP